MFLVAVLLMAFLAAHPARAQQGDAPLASTRWRVVEIAGTPAIHDETLSFSADQLSAKTACNYFGVGYATTGTVLATRGRRTLTVMGCNRVRTREERRFLNALRDVRTFALSGEGLSLMAADGRTLLRFTRH